MSREAPSSIFIPSPPICE